MTREERDFRIRLAAIVDCEGSMGIYHYTQISSTSKPNHCWFPSLVIAQKQKERLLPIQDKLGGRFCYNREAYRLTWDRRRALKIITYLLPTLDWKKEQGQLLLDAWAQWPKSDGQGPGKHTSFDVMSRRANLANSVNAFNGGGRARVVYKVIPSQAPDAINEADEGEGVTVIHERLIPESRDDLVSLETES